jgi:hypothetical protein
MQEFEGPRVAGYISEMFINKGAFEDVPILRKHGSNLTPETSVLGTTYPEP